MIQRVLWQPLLPSRTTTKPNEDEAIGKENIPEDDQEPQQEEQQIEQSDQRLKQGADKGHWESREPPTALSRQTPRQRSQILPSPSPAPATGRPVELDKSLEAKEQALNVSANSFALGSGSVDGAGSGRLLPTSTVGGGSGAGREQARWSNSTTLSTVALIKARSVITTGSPRTALKRTLTVTNLETGRLVEPTPAGLGTKHGQAGFQDLLPPKSPRKGHKHGAEGYNGLID